ncbi:MAG: DUF1893 domain-containing protein, partial [Candidatus Bathyarchaeia archaeon]
MSWDLEKAKIRLHEKGLTIVVVKDFKLLFESKGHGISNLLETLDTLGDSIRGASIADKIVGKAAALLCISAKVKAVYAPIMSMEAKRVLEKYGVYAEWDMLVEKILDSSGKDICPFERAAMEINDPKEAYRKFKTLLEALKSMKNEFDMWEA